MRELFRISLLSAACVVGFGPTIGHPFLYDDHLYVVTNPQTADLGEALASFGTAYPANAPELGLYRPVTVASYALNALATGVDPAAFHALNALLHILATLALYGLARRLLEGRTAPAFAAALLFALHAVHTEAVTWIVGRAEVLATLFALLALRAHVAWRESSRPLHLATVSAAAAAALFSKETAVALGPIVFAFDAIVRREGLFRNLRKRLPSYAVLTIVLAIYLVARTAALGRLAPTADQQVGHGMSGLAIAGVVARIAATYVRLLLVPVNLQVDYALGATEMPGALDVGLSVALIAALAVLFVSLRRVSPAAAFGGAFAVLALGPVSQIVPMGAFIAERFLYLSSAGAALVLGIAGARLAASGRERRAFVLALVPLWLLVLTLVRNRDWADEEAFWTAAIRSNPRSYRSHVNLGNHYRERKQYSAAESTFRAAALLAEKPVEALSNLGEVLTLSGKAEEAIEAFRRASEADPGSNAAASNLGNALARAGRLADAERTFRQIVSKDPSDAAAKRDLALVLVDLGRADEAVLLLEALAAASPDDARLRFDLAEALRAASRLEEAVGAYARALELEPGHVPARLNRAASLLFLERVDEARLEYEAALRVSPGLPAAAAGLRACRRKLEEARDASPPPGSPPPAPRPHGDG